MDLQKNRAAKQKYALNNSNTRQTTEEYDLYNYPTSTTNQQFSTQNDIYECAAKIEHVDAMTEQKNL